MGFAAGLALVAGQRSMQVGAAEYPHPPGAAFEVIGVDFLVDSTLRPWLLEFNAIPSMARQVTAGSMSIAFGPPPPWPAPALLCSGVHVRFSSTLQGCDPSAVGLVVLPLTRARDPMLHSPKATSPQVLLWCLNFLSGMSRCCKRRAQTEAGH